MNNSRFRSQILALLLLCVWPSLLSAQAVVPHANDTRVGGQLIYYFDAAEYDVVYLTLTNTGASDVPLHIQLYTSECQEMLNFRIVLRASCSRLYDMRRFELPGGQTVDFKGVKGFLVATPVTPPPETAAVPYNHLAGSSTHASFARQNSFGVNAISRLAVNSLGVPLADFSGILEGTTRFFQKIQPARLYQDSVFALDNLTDSRIILFSFTDNYFASNYFLTNGGTLDLPVSVRAFATPSINCQKLSIQDQTFGCTLEIDLPTYLGGAAGAFRRSEGFMELVFLSYQANQNVVGISSQTLGPYTANRYMWAK